MATGKYGSDALSSGNYPKQSPWGHKEVQDKMDIYGDISNENSPFLPPLLAGVTSLLSKGNPYLQLASLALPLIGRFLGGGEQNPRQELEREIIQARKERLADLRRQAKGRFTPSERQDIRAANEQILNRVASNLAQRGLEVSGVAGRILAEAEQMPFFEAQKQALAQLNDYEIKTFDLAQKMVKEDDGFVKDLQKLLKFVGGTEKGKEYDIVLKNLDTAITSFQKLLGELNQLRGGQL